MNWRSYCAFRAWCDSQLGGGSVHWVSTSTCAGTRGPPAAYQRVRARVAMVSSGALAFGSLPVEDNLLLVRGWRAEGKGWRLEGVYDLFPALTRLHRCSSG